MCSKTKKNSDTNRTKHDNYSTVSYWEAHLTRGLDALFCESKFRTWMKVYMCFTCVCTHNMHVVLCSYENIENMFFCLKKILFKKFKSQSNLKKIKFCSTITLPNMIIYIFWWYCTQYLDVSRRSVQPIFEYYLQCWDIDQNVPI